MIQHLNIYIPTEQFQYGKQPHGLTSSIKNVTVIVLTRGCDDGIWSNPNIHVEGGRPCDAIYVDQRFCVNAHEISCLPTSSAPKKTL
jgi:hypothetical protein